MLSPVAAGKFLKERDYCLLKEKEENDETFSSLWSCRESNPGPNKSAIRLLHAYLMINCRE